MSEQNFLENQIIILTKQTLDVFLQQKNPMELIGVYSFYYYTAKWQKTNQIKCTTGYVAKGLSIGEAKVRAVKKQLIDLGLIEDVQSKDENNRITGHYIKINYVFKKETLDKLEPPLQNSTGWNEPQGGNNHSVENEETNALSSNNLNALSSNNLNALSNNMSSAPNEKPKETDKEDMELYTRVINYLNEKTKKRFRANNKKTKSLIKSLLKDNYTEDDIYTVIDNQCQKWIGTKMEDYLRPETLFGSKFEGYLNSNPFTIDNNSNQNNGFKQGGYKTKQEREREEWDAFLNGMSSMRTKGE